jgi:5-methylcytosine-specific restriction endonuclease McrA
MIYPQPKPKKRLIDKIAVALDDKRRAVAFRREVWTRDGGCCRECGRVVIHTLELVPNRGDVHHRRGRNVAPADRYNVRRAVLLCAACHADADVIAKWRKGVDNTRPTR